MKEFADYIGRRFSYGSDIQWSLDNEMKTGVPSPMRLTGTGDDRELSSDQKFVWGEIMMDYVKRETNIYENCNKSYMPIFGQCTNNMCSKLEACED